MRCGGRDESVQDHDEADRPSRSPEQADANVPPRTSATWVAHALEDAFAGAALTHPCLPSQCPTFDRQVSGLWCYTTCSMAFVLAP